MFFGFFEVTNLRKNGLSKVIKERVVKRVKSLPIIYQIENHCKTN